MADFLTEIRQQPQALLNTLEHAFDLAADMEFLKVWRPAETVIFAGMGSSYFAPLAAVNLLSSLGHRSIALDASELLHYNLGLVRRSDLPLLISQSGESIETVKLAPHLRQRVDYLAALTNETGSSLAAAADFVLPTMAGREEMTSSKTYVSTLALLFVLAYLKEGDLPADVRRRLLEVPSRLAEWIERVDGISERAIDWLGRTDHLEIIARGSSLATARQGALVLKEASGTLSEAMAGGEFRHGPMEAVRQGFKAVILAPATPSYGLNADMARDMAAFGAGVLFVTSTGRGIKEDGIFNIEIEEDDPYLFTLFDIQVIDFLAIGLAGSRGYIPGTFNRGAKVTTRE